MYLIVRLLKTRSITIHWQLWRYQRFHNTIQCTRMSLSMCMASKCPWRVLLRLRSIEKGSNPTVKKVSRVLLGRIQTLPRVNEKVFGDLQYNSMRNNLLQQRKRLAEKLSNPELRRLTFTSIRHFYGTKLYHKGKPLLEIQKIMGHKRFTSTLQYINYEKQIYGGTEEWVCKVAESEEDRKRLIKKGFEFVEQVDGKSYYRKQKDWVRVSHWGWVYLAFFSNCFT